MPDLIWKALSSWSGCQPVEASESTQRHPIGTTIKAAHPTYGMAEFIYLPGVANTTAGKFVIYNIRTPSTALILDSLVGPVGMAMSANVAGKYGWYLIMGFGYSTRGAASSNTAQWNSIGAYNTAGVPEDYIISGLGVPLTGAWWNSAKGSPSGEYSEVHLHYPTLN